MLPYNAETNEFINVHCEEFLNYATTLLDTWDWGSVYTISRSVLKNDSLTSISPPIMALNRGRKFMLVEDIFYIIYEAPQTKIIDQS